MSNSERKCNLAKTSTAVKPPCHKQLPGQSESLVPSTSSERIPHSNSERQSKLFAPTWTNTNDQRIKHFPGQSPPPVLSTSCQCSSAEKQSNTDKSLASTLKSNHDENSTQTPGQSQPSTLSTQTNNPTFRDTVQDQINANAQKSGSEFIDCGTVSTAAVKAQGFPRKKHKFDREYQHGSFPSVSSGNPDDPLHVAGTSSKTNTDLQRTVDQGGSHVPGIDTEEAKTEKPMRSCKEIDDILKGAKHSSDMQEQTGNLGNKQITDSRDLETKQSGYGTSNNLGSAKSAEERKQNNVVKLEKEPNEFQIMHSKITEKITYSTAWNQGRPMPVAQQDFCTQTTNNNSEKKDETCHGVDTKNEDKTKIVDGLAGLDSIPTKRYSSICDLYFKEITYPKNTLEFASGIKSSDGSRISLTQNVDSVLDNGKNDATELNAPCPDSDFADCQIEIPTCFHKKAEKSRNPETYRKKVSTTVQGVITKLCNCTKQAEELLATSQNLHFASENLQQLLDDHKNLNEKMLPDIKNEIMKWNHPPYNEILDKFTSYLQSIEACLQTWTKKIKADLKLKNAEAAQLRSNSFSIIEPLQELYGLKAQTEELKQQLLVIPKLECTKMQLQWTTGDLKIASQNLEENINLLEDLEKNYAEAKFVFNVDLESVKECEIESMLSQLKTTKNALTGLCFFKYKKETIKKYQDILSVLQSTVNSLERRRKQFEAKQEFENLVSLTANLKNRATNCKGNGLENAASMKSIESVLPKFRMFNVHHIYWIPKNDRESVRKTIREHEDELKKVLKVLTANENLKALDIKFEHSMKVSNNFNGTSSELKILISNVENLLRQYQQFLTFGQNAFIQTKVNNSIWSLQTCVTNLKHQQPGIEANEKFEYSCKDLRNLLKEVDHFWGPSSEIKKWIHKLSEQLDFYLKFQHMGNEVLESKIKRVRKEILLAQDSLKNRQPLIEAEEIFEKTYSQTSTILKEVNDFWGPSSEIKNLFQKLSEALNYYKVFEHMGRECLDSKLKNVQVEIITAQDNLRHRQTIIEALECLAIIRGQAEGLQKIVSCFKGDMSLLRNYMREVEKLQSDLSAFNTIDNEKVKKEAESVSQTIRSTLLNLEGIELQLENGMAESMNVEECAEKESPDLLTHQLKESSNMERICNITMQLMSIYRQLSNNGINVMDSNQLRWLNMRNADLEETLVNNIKPKTIPEEKAFDNAKKLCLQIQQMMSNNKDCEEISPELYEIRATAMKALEIHTKIFTGDISNNQIRWLETQLIECQTKLDRLELPEGVARESRKDVLNLCNQAMLALKKHSYCKN